MIIFILKLCLIFIIIIIIKIYIRKFLKNNPVIKNTHLDKYLLNIDNNNINFEYIYSKIKNIYKNL